jgi:hypothetical protein
MLVPQNEAWKYIGHINPGVGYWWGVTNHQAWLWFPSVPSLATDWPELLRHGLVCGAVVILFGELWKRYGRKHRG